MAEEAAQKEISLLKQGLSGKPEDGIQRRIEAGKATRWRPGQASPNPKGRPREDELPISNNLRRVLERRLPKGELREKIEMVAGKLPKRTTVLDALSLMTVFGAMGEFPKLRLDIVREIREATEGRAAQRTYIPGEVLEEAVSDNPSDLEDRILFGMMRVMRRRKEIYGLDAPELDALEKEGIEESRKAG